MPCGKSERISISSGVQNVDSKLRFWLNVYWEGWTHFWKRVCDAAESLEGLLWQSQYPRGWWGVFLFCAVNHQMCLSYICWWSSGGFWIWWDVEGTGLWDFLLGKSLRRLVDLDLGSQSCSLLVDTQWFTSTLASTHIGVAQQFTSLFPRLKFYAFISLLLTGSNNFLPRAHMANTFRGKVSLNRAQLQICLDLYTCM